MIYKQFYLSCLAHASYLLGSDGEACLIDPQRDIDEYLVALKEENLKLKYVIETHLHADFVSGHMELAEKTGAQIVYSQKAEVNFPHIGVKDNDTLQVGKITITILETPGHTPESICILAKDAATPDAPGKLFTGDTLFIGDVGRPDLAGRLGITPREMAAALYDSLHNKILPLDDSTEVLPAHGAGSLCGKNISSERSSTIGDQRKFNWALKAMTKEAFIAQTTAELPEIPKYFGQAVATNKEGAKHLSELPDLKKMTAKEVKRKQEEGALIVDVRSPQEFGAGHPAGAINIGLGGQFASFGGMLLDAAPEKIIIGTQEQAREAVTRLARAGLENVVGYLSDTDGCPVKTWQDAGMQVVAVPQNTVNDLAKKLETNQDTYVIDVRRPGEYVSGHVPGAKSIPLNELVDRISELDKERTVHVICAGGYRSSMACSLLLQNKFDNLINIEGGTQAWRKAGHAVVEETAGKVSACQG